MWRTRLMVVLALLSVGCVANRAVSPSVAAGMTRTQSRIEDTVISDRGTPIAGQRYCWLYLPEATYLFPADWHECEGLKALVWERHDHKTDKWVPES